MKTENFPFEDENINYEEPRIGIFNPNRQLHINNKRFKNYGVLYYSILILFMISNFLSMIFDWNSFLNSLIFVTVIFIGYIIMRFDTKLSRWLNNKTII